METCLFCLESTSLATNPLLSMNFSKYPDVCSCRIYSHFDCWMIYYLKKGYFECPICHTKCDQRESTSDPNIIVSTENVLVQITAPTPRIQFRRPVPSPVRDHSYELSLRRVTLCFLFGCVSCTVLFLICLFVPIFIYLKN